MKKLFLLFFCGHLLSGDSNAQITNSSYINQYGEKVLQLSVIVPVDKKAAWKLFSTEAGLKKWIAPVVAINMTTGGYVKTNYDKNKNIDDSTSIRLDITNYLEYEMMTLKVYLNNNFPAQVKAGDKNLQEIIQFADAGKGKTKLVSSMIGWGQGADWDKAYHFFEIGNDWTYKELLSIFKK